MPPSPLPIDIFSSLDSTNDEGKRRLQSGQYRLPSILWAHTQTHGRGTQGRLWESPERSGLYFSLVVPNHSPLSLSLSVDITQDVAQVCVNYFNQWQLPVAIKPINDLMLPLPNDKQQLGKAGGILVESLMQGSTFLGYVIGIGLNWTAAPDVTDTRHTSVAFADHWPDIQQHNTETIINELCQALLTMVIHRYGEN